VVAIGPIRSRHTHEALRRSSSRGRSGSLTVLFLEQNSWSEAEVAYAISRRVGTAVVRNRLRRRLKAIMTELAPSLVAGAYVVRTGPGSSTLDYEELRVAMSRAVERATHRQSPSPHPNIPSMLETPRDHHG
jgi:ribonuclease P protein component